MFAAVDAAWEHMPAAEREAICSWLRQEIDNHARHPDALWALDQDGLSDLAAFLDTHDPDGAEPPASAWFTVWPKFPGFDPFSDDAKDKIRSARLAAVVGLDADTIAAFASETAEPVQVGLAVAETTEDLDNALLPWLLSPDVPRRSVAQGLTQFRVGDSDAWLTETVAKYPDLAIALMLTVQINKTLLSLLQTLSEVEQVEFWTKAAPWAATVDTRIVVASAFASHNRPFSAAGVLTRLNGPMPVDLGVGILSQVIGGATEAHDDLERSLGVSHTFSRMLNLLEEAGADDATLAGLEWNLNPALRQERQPRALYRAFASDFSLFAEIVAASSPPDLGSEDDSNEIQEDFDLVQNAMDVLQSWALPLPAGSGSDAPDSVALNTWVEGAFTELAERNRSGAALSAIGDALSGPVDGSDDIWPCEAVRDVLERVNEPELEAALVVGRLRGGGATARDVESGGTSERSQADTYREQADALRGRWPRTGVVLDQIANILNQRGKREDWSADEHGDY